MAITLERAPSEQGAGRGAADLRTWLAEMERLGEVQHVDGANLESEIGEIVDLVQHSMEAPAILLDRIPGLTPGFRLLANAIGARDRIAYTLGLPLGLAKVDLAEAWRKKLKGIVPVPPEVVADGPIFENVLRGADVDVLRFPAPKWHPEDGGRYLGTGSYDITRDPDDGWVNCGTYRVMVHSANQLGYYISPGKHGRQHRQKYFDRGEKCPVAMVFGGDPLMFLASCTEVPFGLSEFDWVGGIRGEPVRVIRGPVTGLPIPADAEVVVEGYADGSELLTEGPFGEWTGYYGSDQRPEPVLKVEAVYYRNDPIILASPPGRPPDEQAKYRAVMRTALLRDQLDKAGVPDVVGAWCHEVGGSRLFNVVAIKQRYPGHSRQAMHLAAQVHATAYSGRWTIVVDDDIDPTDLDEVLWALCTRADPATSIDIIERAWSTPLDPRMPPAQKAVKNFTNSRGLIDATRPWEWRDQFPPLNIPPKASREAARQRWGYLLERPGLQSR